MRTEARASAEVARFVESRTGRLLRSCGTPRFHSPLIKPTCGFPASGFPTWFHLAAHGGGPSSVCVAEAVGRGQRAGNTDRRPSHPRGKASSEASGYAGVFQAHRQSPILGSVQSAPEVRALSSASITRPQRSSWPSPTPVRPAACASWGAASPSRDGSLPMTRITLPTCRAPVPPADRDGCLCRLLPRSHGLPRFPGGSASASSLSRPPQASRALRPAGLLNRPRRPLARAPAQSVAPDQTARQLPEQSTTLRVEPSSTGDTRRRGALGNTGSFVPPAFPWCSSLSGTDRLFTQLHRVSISVSRRRVMRVRLTALLVLFPFVLLGITAGLRAQQQDTGRLHGRVIVFVWDGLRADDLTLRTSRRTISRSLDPASCLRITTPSIRPSR